MSLRSFYNFDKFDSNYTQNVKAFMIKKKTVIEAANKIQLSPDQKAFLAAKNKKN